MSCCDTQINARRNADFRFTYGPSSRKFTFSGMYPRFSVRRGEIELLAVTDAATVNGSSFVVVGDDIVLTVTKEDLALLDSASPDTQSEDLFYDITLTDGSGFENWLLGNAFVLLGINDDSSCNCNGTAEVSLGGQCIEIAIEGGNIAAGASVSLSELNQAVRDAEDAAETADASATASQASAQAAQDALNDIDTGLASKADSDAGNITAGTWRTALGLGGSATLNVGTTAGTVAAGNDSRFAALESGKADKNFTSSLASPTTRLLTDKVGEIYSVNDTSDLQAALDAISAAGGGVIHLTADVDLVINADLVIPPRCGVLGEFRCPGAPGRHDDDTVMDFTEYKGVAWLHPDSSIVLEESAWWEGVPVFRQGITANPAFDAVTYADEAQDVIDAFAGTAFKIRGDDTYIGHSLVLGFEHLLDSGDAGNPYQRQRIEYVSGDCINGLEIENSLDLARMRAVHMWPYLTAYAPGFPGPLDEYLTREGNAYRFGIVNDGMTVSETFSFGYGQGFVFDGVADMTATACWADAPSSLTTNLGTIGFHVLNGSRATNLMGCKASSVGRGAVLNSANSHTLLVGWSSWVCQASHIEILQGDVTLIAPSFNRYGGPTSSKAIIIGPSAGRVRVIAPTFTDMDCWAIDAGYDRRKLEIISPAYIGSCTNTLQSTTGAILLNRRDANNGGQLLLDDASGQSWFDSYDGDPRIGSNDSRSWTLRVMNYGAGAASLEVEASIKAGFALGQGNYTPYADDAAAAAAGIGLGQLYCGTGGTARFRLA